MVQTPPKKAVFWVGGWRLKKAKDLGYVSGRKESELLCAFEKYQYQPFLRDAEVSSVHSGDLPELPPPPQKPDYGGAEFGHGDGAEQP